MASNNKKVYTIGREGDISVSDPESTVSKQHAELIVDFDEKKYYLTDIGSMNGTYIQQNGAQQPFYQGFVEVDDHVVFGKYHCTIRDLLNTLKAKGFNVFFVGDAAPRSDKEGSSSTTGDEGIAIVAGSVNQKEITGARRRCMHCGNVILMMEKTCSQCGGKQ